MNPAPLTDEQIDEFCQFLSDATQKDNPYDYEYGLMTGHPPLREAFRLVAAALASPQVAAAPREKADALWDAIDKFGDICYLRAIHHDSSEWLKDPNEPRVTHIEVNAAQAALRRLFDETLATPVQVAPQDDARDKGYL